MLDRSSIEARYVARRALMKRAGRSMPSGLTCRLAWLPPTRWYSIAAAEQRSTTSTETRISARRGALCEAIGRPIATSPEAREIVGVRSGGLNR
jgi:hypothetical protein